MKITCCIQTAPVSLVLFRYYVDITRRNGALAHVLHSGNIIACFIALVIFAGSSISLHVYEIPLRYIAVEPSFSSSFPFKASQVLVRTILPSGRSSGHAREHVCKKCRYCSPSYWAPGYVFFCGRCVSSLLLLYSNGILGNRVITVHSWTVKISV